MQNLKKNAEVEYIFVELNCESRKLLIGAVYIPPKSRNLTSINLSTFESTLSDFASIYTDCIFGGDFNMNTIFKSSRTTAFLDIISTMGFTTIGSEPTHFTDTSATCIDYFIVTNQSMVKYNGQLENIGISYHDIVYLSYDFPVPVSEPKTIEYRRYDDINLNNLITDVYNLQWDSIYMQTSADDMITILNSFLLQLFNFHVPLRCFTIRSNQLQ